MRSAIVVVIGIAALVGSAACSTPSGITKRGKSTQSSSSSSSLADAGAPAKAVKAGRASGPGGYPANVTPDPMAVRLCEALHVVPGRRVAECCGGPTTRFFADECTRVVSASLADGAIRIEAAKVDACASAMTPALQGCDWITPSQPVPPAACRGVIEGRLAAGAECRSHLDCRDGLHCGPDGACIAPEPNGATCGRSVDTLSSHSRQNEVGALHPICAEHCSLVTHKCEPVPAVGARCFANVGCAKGHLCVDAKCTPATPGRVGEACIGGTCDDGLRCVAAKCQPMGAPGDSCTSDFDCGVGGCHASGDSGARVCGMTCSHTDDLAAIRKVLASSPAAPPAKRAAR